MTIEVMQKLIDQGNQIVTLVQPNHPASARIEVIRRLTTVGANALMINTDGGRLTDIELGTVQESLLKNIANVLGVPLESPVS